VAGQDVAHRCGMTSGTAFIRGRDIGMDFSPLSRSNTMAYATVRFLR
jgi:hypothetical protein